MKKLIFIIILILLPLLSTFVCYGENSPQSRTKLFYAGKTYELNNPVLFENNDYLFHAGEISSKLGMTLEKEASTVIITYNGISKRLSIKNRPTSSNSQNSIHESMEIINSELYLPFSVLKSTYKMIIKYNGYNNTVYIFPEGNTHYDFSNLTYDYVLGSSSGFSVSSTESETNFQENSIPFIHQNHRLSAVLTCDRLDRDALANMRKYLNDSTSDDKAIFQRFVEYKMSYFSAMQDYYKRDFLYGMSTPDTNELNMKVINEYKEKLFGQDADIVLYNVIKADKFSPKEETHLNLTIPVLENMTVYSINFSLPAGDLDTAATREIMGFLRNLRILKLPSQESVLKVFYDVGSISSANSGIYPASKRSSEMSYSILTNMSGRYEITYPSSFVSFRQNNLVDSIDYKSFKIDTNQFISITSQQIADEKAAVGDKLSLIRNYYDKKIKISDEGTKLIGDKVFTYIKYSINDSSGRTFIEDYFLVSNFRLINIQLNSNSVQPNENIQKEFTKLLGSLKTMGDTPAPSANGRMTFNQLLNKEEGYSLLAPTDWKISETDNGDINYDSFNIKTGSYSGPIDITVNEGELNSGLSYIDILKFVTGGNSPELKRYFKKYSAPYLNRISQPLAFSYKYNNDVLYLYKLVNYLDASNRGKLCYSVDIIKGRKIYSLFISVSDYLTTDGKVLDKNLNFAINLIAGSFDIDTTAESQRRAANRESRNRKVIFLENFLKHKFGKNVEVKSIQCLDSKKNLLINSSSSNGSFIYWVKADYENNTAEVLQEINKQELTSTMSEGLKNIFAEKNIQEIKTDPETLKLEIKFRDGLSGSFVTRSYQIAGYLQNNNILWRFDRNDYSNAIKNDCKEFIERFLASKANVYFDPNQDFTELVKSKEKGEIPYVPVFVQFGELSGYFVLKIEPYTDKVILDSYTPLEVIHDRINKLYTAPSNDYTIYNIGMDDSNRFEFQVFLTSKYRISYKLSKVSVGLNPKTKVLEIN